MIPCQSVTGWEAAPALGAAVICVASLVGWPSSRVVRDQREVSPLSRRVRLPVAQPLSASLQRSLRILPPPVPPAPSVCLTVPLPQVRTWGLPCSTALPEWGSSPLSAGSRVDRDKRCRPPCTGRRTFWCKPVSTFGLSYLTAFIRDSRVMTLPLHPSAALRWCSQTRRPVTISR